MKHLSNTPLKAKDRKAVEEAVALLKLDFPVVEVRLFGSKARGDDDSESDIDLLVLTSKQLSWRNRNAMTDALYDIELKHDVVISLLVVSKKQWKNGILTAHPIHDEIETQGVAA